MEEIWQDIPEYEGIYKISNFGTVKTISTDKGMHTGHITYGTEDSKGYRTIKLTKNKTCKTFKVHVLVLKVFIGPRPKNYDINHKDCNKSNNKVDNLEYVNHFDNMKHAYENNLIPSLKGTQQGNAKLSDKDVLEIREKLSSKLFTYKQLAETYKVSEGAIAHIFHGRSWKHV